MSDKKCPYAPTKLTMNNGAPVADNQNSLTAGPRGPLLAQDVWLNEKLGNFVREVIPERRIPNIPVLRFLAKWAKRQKCSPVLVP